MLKTVDGEVTSVSDETKMADTYVRYFNESRQEKWYNNIIMLPAMCGIMHNCFILLMVIAERLSARQLILLRISFCVGMYVCLYVCHA